MLEFIREYECPDYKLGHYICKKCNNEVMIPNYQQYLAVYCNNCEPERKWKHISQAAKCNFCCDRNSCSKREFNFVQIK